MCRWLDRLRVLVGVLETPLVLWLLWVEVSRRLRPRHRRRRLQRLPLAPP